MTDGASVVVVEQTIPSDVVVVEGSGNTVVVEQTTGDAGKDGADGKDGVDGKDGADGKDGVDGKDGADGKDGVDGKDGADGKDGSFTPPPPPDQIDETDPVYFYFGVASVNGGWLVRRQSRANGGVANATTGAADFNTAWATRNNLTYS